MPAEGAIACACLAVVLLLILGAARVARRLPVLRLPSQTASPLTLVGSLALDRVHRLHLVDAAGHRTLVLTGGGTARLIELGPVR